MHELKLVELREVHVHVCLGDVVDLSIDGLVCEGLIKICTTFILHHAPRICSNQVAAAQRAFGLPRNAKDDLLLVIHVRQKSICERKLLVLLYATSE